MPTYSYECKECGHTQDVFHPMSARPRVKCEECGATCRKLLGVGAGVIFKGSGFYETDYKSKSGTADKKESGSDTAKSDSGAKTGESKSEGAKPAAKSDTKPSKSKAASGAD